VVFTTGFTVVAFVVKPPGTHVYVVLACEGVLIVAEAPRQIGFGVAVGVNVGVAFMVTVTVAVPVQPLGEVPVRVYVVVAVGVTETLAPGKVPGDHTKVVPGILLVADKLELVPRQIADGVATALITGLANTLMVIEAVAVQNVIGFVTVTV
jgi:hypothetical protein